jgi:hypothetical protein
VTSLVLGISGNVSTVVQRTIVIVEDDIDGSEAVETVQLTFQGEQYELDLSERNLAQLQKALQPFLSVARRVGGRRRRTMGSSSTDIGVGHPRVLGADIDHSGVADGPVDNAAVREWAESNGIHVSGRGRISRAVVDQYRAAGNQRKSQRPRRSSPE